MPFHTHTIAEIVQFNQSGCWRVNPEYHRGLVWDAGQMRLFIDSILRGYCISPICVVSREDGHAFDIIDGYQRLNAMRCFVDGDDATSERSGGLVKVGALFDPRTNKNMPEFLRDGDRGCWWGGKRFANFSVSEREMFLKTKIAVAFVECASGKARDMFIRLQRVEPLTPQDIRDTYSGDFSAKVRQIGGMLEDEKNGHKPHKFFCTGGQGSGIARRKWISQVAALHFSRKCEPETDFVDIRSQNLDYCARSKFARVSPDDSKRFDDIFDKLTVLFPDDKRKEMLMSGHEVTHLFLLTDMLMDNYETDWEEEIVKAHAWFVKEINSAREKGKAQDSRQDFLTYCKSVDKNPESKHAIRQRHIIYAHKMLKFMDSAIKWIDPDVPYERAGKEFVLYRDNGKCRKCGGDVKWEDAEIHPPLNGKQQPSLDKCALVHKGECPSEKAGD